MEMNNIPWSPVLRYATPLPMNRTPVSTVALQHKSVSSVLRYATPLLINRTPVSTVGGSFPPFCGTPDPSRSTGPRSDRRRSVSSVVRYARPRFHRLFRPSPPDEPDHAFRSDPAGWLPRVPLPPDEHNTFVLSSLYHVIGQRSVSGRSEVKAKHFGLRGMSNKMTR